MLVQAREVDYELVETAIKGAIILYTSQSGLSAPQVQIDKQNPLLPSRYSNASV